MTEWTFETLWRNFQERPLLTPVWHIYHSFMNIERGPVFPFYFSPGSDKAISIGDKVLNFMDWTVDVHEEGRNMQDKHRNFYQRAVYLYKNYFRYANPTMANVMFDTQAPRPSYDKMNSVVNMSMKYYYLATFSTHMLGFMYMTYFFRYRRLGLVPVVAVGAAYYYAFDTVNSIYYKLIVDKAVMQAARDQGLDAHCQPMGTCKNRGFNYR